MTQAAVLAQLGNTPLGMRNKIINGAMEIDQRNGGASLTLTNTSAAYCVDRFQFYRDVGGTFTAQQSSTAPAGFSTSMVVTASTGASPSAAQVNFVQQQIEGFNVADLKWGTSDAKPITISFWVRSSVTGNLPVALSNNGLGRSYIFDATISSANTWTYITKTISGDTSGTWTTNNTAGIRVYFDLGSGSDYVGTADTWASAWDIRTSSSMTWGATTGATLYITGVQLEVGSVATEFERRPYGTELALCQRYFQTYTATNQEWIYNEANSYAGKWWQVYIPTPMRASPSASFEGTWTGGGVVGLSGTISSLSGAASLTRFTCRVTMSVSSGTAWNLHHTDFWGSKRVLFSAEL